jgi:hypothetical protein
LSYLQLIHCNSSCGEPSFTFKRGPYRHVLKLGSRVNLTLAPVEEEGAEFLLT